MAHRKRLSVSSSGTRRSESPFVLNCVPNNESENWVKLWKEVPAKDLVDSPVVTVDAETSVEDACDMLLSKDIFCLAVNSHSGSSPHNTSLHGLFDFSDVNAFLTFAATRHKLPPDELREKTRVEQIVAAAKAGHVPIHLVSNLSEKNPLETVTHDATLIDLLGIFSRGAHRGEYHHNPPSDTGYIGMVSDRRVLSWFADHAQAQYSFLSYLSNPLSSLPLPSIYLYSSVVAAKSSDTVLAAMKLMSNEGVSSLAVVEEQTGGLLSAVSVTDIGKIVVPSQSNQILYTPLHQFIARIREPEGSTDGVDKSPVYSVFPSSTLIYTMRKLLATNAHRLFVTDEAEFSTQTIASASACNLSGIVSIVDILSLFARLANIPDIDPTRMQRHRRASSASSRSSTSSSDADLARSSSWSEHDFTRSRSSSRSRLQRLSASVSSLESMWSTTDKK